MAEVLTITITYLTITTGIFWVGAALWLLVGLIRLKSANSERYPKVSVLIAARNEAGNITRCLTAMTRQDYPTERWELIVVDDNSTDETRSEVRAFRDKFHEMKMLSVDSPPVGVAPKKHALTKGIMVAEGEIILTTDADCVPSTGWISSMVSHFEEGVDAVAGISPLAGKGLVGKLAGLDSLINAVVSAGSIGQGHPVTVAGRNFGFRRSSFLKIGGYGENIHGASGDDDLLLQRISRHGGKVRFSSNIAAHVRSDAPPTLGAWWRMKRRHISAGKRYQPLFILISTMLYLFQVGLILMSIITIMGNLSVEFFLIVLGLKVAVDMATVTKGALIMSARKWLFPFVIAELISPFLFAILIPAAMVGKIRWKGRELDR